MTTEIKNDEVIKTGNAGEAIKTDEVREAKKADEVREMICIKCPIGCRLKAERMADGSVTVTGNTCNRGVTYATEEMTNPTRTVTSSVPVTGGHMELLSVKTKVPVPKTSILQVLKELRVLKVVAPVKVGDVVLPNAAGTGVDIVATRSIRKGGANHAQSAV